MASKDPAAYMAGQRGLKGLAGRLLRGFLSLFLSSEEPACLKIARPPPLVDTPVLKLFLALNGSER